MPPASRKTNAYLTGKLKIIYACDTEVITNIWHFRGLCIRPHRSLFGHDDSF